MSARNCPTLRTARLTLAAHAPEDFDDVLAMWSDPEVVRYMGGAPSTPDAVWDRLLRYAGLWGLFGFGFWRVRETTGGRYVGDVGLMEMRRQIDPAFFGTPEAGWSLMTWAHGLGYAREAAEAVMSWADRTLSYERTVCMIHPDNAPSLRLAARLGFEAYAEARYKDRPVVLLERAARRAS